MKIGRMILFALVGWVGGGLTTLGLGLVWPAIFPGILRVSPDYGAGPGLPMIIGIVLILASPAALAGGLIGGRLSREGGQSDQIRIAAIGGASLALPFGCLGYWLLSGS